MDSLKRLYWSLATGDPIVNLGLLVLACLLVLALLVMGLRRDRQTPWAVPLMFASAFGLFFLLGPHAVNVYDEGLILAGALRILGGEMPSADFYSNYGPAQFYLVAGLLKMFGQSLTVTRMYDALMAAAILPAAWWTLRDTVARWQVPVALSLIFVLLLSFSSPLYPITPAIAFILIGCQATIRVSTGSDVRSNSVLLAIAIAVLTVFRYDLGVLAVAAFGMPILLVLALQLRANAITMSYAAKTLGLTASLVGLGLVVTLGGLALSGILAPAIHDIVAYNSANYVAMRSLPFPGFVEFRAKPFASAVVYFPIAASLLGGFAFLRCLRKAGGALDSRHVAIAVLTSVTLVFYTKGIVRVSPIHTLVADVPAVILFFVSLSSLADQSTAGAARTVKLVSGAFVLGMLLVAGAHASNVVSSRDRLFRHLGQHFGHPDVPALGVFSTNPERIEAARYVIEATAPTDRIHVGTGRHDKIFVNDVAFYFLVQRLPATRWHHYDPGVQTTESVQRAIIADLEDRGVKVIVVDQRWDQVAEPNKSAESSGVTLLDEYISDNFREVRTFGTISVYRR